MVVCIVVIDQDIVGGRKDLDLENLGLGSSWVT
jgi:hypothetical protein